MFKRKGNERDRYGQHEGWSNLKFWIWRRAKTLAQNGFEFAIDKSLKSSFEAFRRSVPGRCTKNSKKLVQSVFYLLQSKSVGASHGQITVWLRGLALWGTRIIKKYHPSLFPFYLAIFFLHSAWIWDSSDGVAVGFVYISTKGSAILTNISSTLSIATVTAFSMMDSRFTAGVSCDTLRACVDYQNRKVRKLALMLAFLRVVL